MLSRDGQERRVRKRPLSWRGATELVAIEKRLTAAVRQK